ncbi:MAG: HK97 gp10 family phage protein [Moraxella sp.]|nr:HK97 gp10 family phage protein [Moraxella sp.]
MWSTPPSLFANLVADEVDRKYRKFATDVYNNLVALSPVDTGRYKANHIISIGSPNFSQLSSTTEQGSGVVLTIPRHTYPTIYIQNNLPYASVIEFGGYPNPVKRGTRVKRNGKWVYEIRSSGGFSIKAPTGVYGNAFWSAIAMQI